ncbi:hypothetical protein HHI36_007591 [Cryptolaemus montrouzieri]|uniref:Uncharacterized protein n=1 Tax=Cryptolaemus montrouzieri TaxID=559131 RepID=A0ABD2MQ22_9CUCU
MTCLPESFPPKTRQNYRKVKKKTLTTSELEKLRKNVDAAITIHRVRKEEISKYVCRGVRKQYKTAIDSEIRKYLLEQMRCSADPQKTTWKVINLTIQGPKIRETNCIITANDFNKFFSNISGLLTSSVLDTVTCMNYVKNIQSSDYGTMCNNGLY